MYRCAVCRKRAIKRVRSNRFFEPRCSDHESLKFSRKILDHGQVVFQELSKNESKLLEAMPGHRYIKGTHWVSTKIEDRARVLHLANKIGFECSPEFCKIPLTIQAHTAKDAGLYDFQIEGVNFLSHRKKALLGDEMGAGKSIHEKSLVLTPKGYRPACSIEVGDKIIGKSGKPCVVKAKYNNPNLNFYQIKFSDNTKIPVCEDHLWEVRRGNGKPFIRSTKELLEIKDYKALKIPFVEPVRFRKKKLINPYVVGYFLGNGNYYNDRLSFAVNIDDIDVVSRIGSFFKGKFKQTRIYSKKMSRYTKCWKISVYESKEKKIFENFLKKESLHSKICDQKFIPSAYFYGSVNQRLQLLYGLMDSDGYPNNKKKGLYYRFSSTSYKLCHGIRSLVQSLGGFAKINRPSKKRKNKKPCWQVRVELPDNKIPFSSSRQVFRSQVIAENKKRSSSRNIREIKSIGKRNGICFTVDDPSHLYVVQHYIVTHNTVQAVRSIGPEDRAIVVSPSCVKYNWRDEVHQWAPYLIPTVIKKKKDFRWPEKGEVILVNYEILPKYLEPVKENERDPSWKTVMKNVPKEVLPIAEETRVIVDECHKVKNGRTNMSKRVNGLQRITKSIWGLTGTPLLNNPGDLWGMLCNLGMSWDIFKNFDHFKRLYKAYMNKFGGIQYGKADPIVPELLRRVMLRRTRDKVLPDLPPKVYKEMIVDRIPKDLQKELDEAYGKWGPLLLCDELPEFSAFSGVRQALAKSRIPSMLEYIEICEENNVPILVFSYHREPILEAAKRDGWEYILGDTPAKKRRDIVKRFQSGELKGVSLSIGAGGVGLTLTRAWKILFVDLDWTPALNLQAEDRAARIGQKNDSVEIIRMVTDHPLDMHIMRLLTKKINMINDSIEKEISVKPKNTVGAQVVVEDHVLNQVRKIENPRFEDSLEKCKRFIKLFDESVNGKKKLRYKYKEDFDEMLNIALAKVKPHLSKTHEFILKHIENVGLENKTALELLFLIIVQYKNVLKSEKDIKKLFKRKREKDGPEIKTTQKESRV